MLASQNDKVTLRIRFAGLCLFVPKGGEVHVLMPHTDHRSHAHQGGGHSMEPHFARIHWLSGGQPQWKPLDHTNLVLDGIGGGPANFNPAKVFDLGELVPDSPCTNSKPGAVDVANAPTIARMSLGAGKSRVVNPGARWNLPKSGKDASMATVVDWFVRDVERDALTAMLKSWEVFGTKLPDFDDKKRINLWVVHAPEEEHKPAQIGADHNLGHTLTGEHFTAYYPLLACGNYTEIPLDPRPETVIADPEAPHWPEKSLMGMLLSCMVASAEPA